MARNIVIGSNAGSGGGGGAPTGAAGGSLAGTYPNPTIAASAITTTEIADGTIVTGDLSATAGITSGQLAGSIAASKISGTAITAADSGTVTSTMIADGTVAVGDMTAASLERVITLGKGGAIGATETNAADFQVCVPYNCTALRMKATTQTAVSGAMTVQLRSAGQPVTTPPTFADMSAFVCTFSNGNVLAVVDPANINLTEGDFLNFSCATGSGTNLLVEVVVVLR